jgi:hypothetical protein
MKQGFILSAILSVLLPRLCACGNKSANTDTRCPALVEKAEYYNTQTANGTKEGSMGMKMSVEYIDSVYRIIQIVDESIIPAEKIKMFYGNMKQNMIVGISSSSGSERRDYKQMVDYRVTFEHVVKSKSTGDVIVRNTMTPDEIAEALEKQLTPLDELKMNVTTQKGTLPRGMEAGYTMNDISCSDGVVNIEIIVDEKMKDFDEATKLKAWSKAEQAVTLADQTTGLTFWSVAAQVPAEFDFHFVGSKGNNDLHIRFSKDEVVEFNEVMERIKDQQYKQ